VFYTNFVTNRNNSGESGGAVSVINGKFQLSAGRLDCYDNTASKGGEMQINRCVRLFPMQRRMKWCMNESQQLHLTKWTSSKTIFRLIDCLLVALAVFVLGHAVVYDK